ncbi:MAG: hypothetical protein HS114_34645 [Anaerolineales bacterium]|nr:hypothetical protein [Anaerolineales bacterium]
MLTMPEEKKSSITKILEEILLGESRLVIFSVKGQLFKARFSQYSTILHLWTPAGWQLYYRADRKIPDEDIYDMAAKTATMLATPRQ